MGSWHQRKAWADLGFRVDEVVRPADGSRVRTCVIRFENLELELTHSDSEENAESRVTSWAWSHAPTSPDSTVGLARSLPMEALPHEYDKHFSPHPNCVRRVDHVVLRTSDCGRTMADLQHAGLHLARDRSDVYKGIRQMFFKTAPWGVVRGAVVEVVGPAAAVPTAEGKEVDGSGTTTRSPQLPGTANSGSFLGVKQQQGVAHGDDANAVAYDVVLWGLALESTDLDATLAAAAPRSSAIKSAVQKGRRILTLKPEEDLGLALAVLSAREAPSEATGPPAESRAHL